MELTNFVKNEAIKLAKEYQQYYYELLPDWFEYSPEDYELIRHKIGYALFGTPMIDNDSQTSLEGCMFDNNQQDNIFSNVKYDKTMCKVIDTVYQKIIQYGKDNANSFIYVGVIFNVLFLHTTSKKSDKKDTTSNKEPNNICVVPIFKLKTETYGIWYIDTEGRIYKTWRDYVTNNTLPQCTMILPKNGLYQYNPNYKITECLSTAWVEILDSPACAVKNKVLKGIDIAANTLSICTTVGLGAASFLTPIGPAVCTAGLLYGGVSGLWMIGRSSQKLKDRAEHKQSINPTNKAAFSSWLGIGSTVLTLGANGGTMLLNNALTKAGTVGTAAKVAYRSVMLSNLTVNAAGIAYQGYCLIDKYRTKKEVDYLDIVLFTSHVLFFTNTLINFKLAGELIGTSKGTIFEKFKTAVRVNRLKTEFNKTKLLGDRNVQNKGIVSKINRIVNVEDFFNALNKIKGKCPVKYDGGNIVVNNRVFIDPITFAGHLLTVGAFGFNLLDPNSSSTAAERNDVMIKLKLAFKQLLKEFYAEKQLTKEQIPDVNYFNHILQEMKYIDNWGDILIKSFKIAVTIVEHCNNPQQFLCDAICFSWTYCKANLKEYNVSGKLPKNRLFSILARIVTFLYESIDDIANELFGAFYAYMLNSRLDICNSQF